MRRGDVQPDAETTGTATGGAAARRSDPWKVAFVTLIVVALLAVVTWLLLGSRLLVVRDVRVTGAHRLDPGRVEAAADVETGTPLVRVDTDAAAGRVRDLRLAESARVVRQWPATLRVEVTEREPELSVKVSDGYRLVDRGGVRIADSEKRPASAPLVSVKGEVEGNPAISTAAGITRELPEPVLDKLDTVKAEDRGEIVLTLDGGARVEWGDGERAEEKGKVLAVLMREHPPRDGRGYDVSAPDMAVIT